MSIARRTSGSAAALASLTLAAAGCSAILGLGDEPTEGVTLDGTTASASTTTGGDGTTDAAGTSVGSTGGDGGGEVGGGASASSTGGGVGGSGGGSGGAAGCDDPEPVDFSCGPCVDCDGECFNGGECARRIVRVPNTSRVTEVPADIFNRYGRGLAVGGDVIAFTRNVDPSAENSAILTVVRSDGTYGELGMPPALYAVASDPGGTTIVLTRVDVVAGPSLWRVAPDGPSIGTLAFDAPAGHWGALAWQSGTRFVAAGRDAAQLWTFDTATDDAPCPFGTPQGEGAGVDVVHGLFAGAPTVLAPHFNSDSVSVEVEAAVDACGVPTPTDSVLQGIDVNNTSGIALACNRVYAQGLSTDSMTGVVSRLDTGATQSTYPSQAIAAHRDRVYVPQYTGGVLLCDADLGSCDEVLDVGRAGSVSLLRATRRGFVSVGLADPGEESSDTIVACVNHAAD